MKLCRDDVRVDSGQVMWPNCVDFNLPVCNKWLLNGIRIAWILGTIIITGNQSWTLKGKVASLKPRQWGLVQRWRERNEVFSLLLWRCNVPWQLAWMFRGFVVTWRLNLNPLLLNHKRKGADGEQHVRATANVRMVQLSLADCTCKCASIKYLPQGIHKKRHSGD